jgi:hypothetical protein
MEKENIKTAMEAVAYNLQSASGKSQSDLAGQPVSDADYIQLSRLVLEHGNRTDIGRADTTYELYVDDGELLLPGTPLHGHKEIREWGQQLVANTPWRTIRHSASNMRFVYDGPNRAKGTTMLTVFMIAGDGPATTIPWSVGEDHDEFVRTENGWKFKSRQWVELFSRGDAVAIS